MSFFGKLWSVIKGFFIRAGDDAVSGSPEAIRSAYATAIDDAKHRYKDMERAVALLAAEREKTALALKKLAEEDVQLHKKIEGALRMAETEPDNNAHREAGARYLARQKEIDEKEAQFAAELDAQTQRVEEYKTKLRSFTAEIDRLKKEQGEMVAEFVSNQQMIQLEDRLKGVGETAVDESIVAIREKIGRMKAEAKIAAEMRGATVNGQDETYERAGAEKAAENEFDQLLKARMDSKVATPEKERDLG